LSLSNPARSDEHDKRGVPTSSLSLRCTKSHPPTARLGGVFLSQRCAVVFVKKPASTTADAGKVAGGKPATGRLCQAGLRKMGEGPAPRLGANSLSTKTFPEMLSKLSSHQGATPRTTPGLRYAQP
jgi:hypothetical protein